MITERERERERERKLGKFLAEAIPNVQEHGTTTKFDPRLQFDLFVSATSV